MRATELLADLHGARKANLAIDHSGNLDNNRIIVRPADED
jgi:hypothetical protein